MNRKVDYIIIGQGLAGSALAWTLITQGKSVLVYDRPDLNRSSSAAAGIYNPITGRVMTSTWNASQIFPYLEIFYQEAEVVTGKKLLHAIPVYRPFLSEQEQNSWRLKSEQPDLKDFVRHFYSVPVDEDQVINPWGGIEINHSGYLDVARWINTVREYLQATHSYREENFNEEKMQIKDVIRYDDIEARKIIFCNGLAALNSTYWKWLPLKSLKGETLEIKMMKKPERIFNRGAYIVPSGETHHYVVGATYVHPPFEEGPTLAGREEILGKLNELLVSPYEVVHQRWGIRPTTPDRRPVLGPHPANKNVCIFNGLGTKGVSLAPYFAKEMAFCLDGSGSLSDSVNINRFKALYSR